jgi:predicted ribosome quality control (RQC) complex YloA/Tae2 family protein
VNPFEADGSDIDRYLESLVADGESLFEVIRRRVFGVGSEGAALIVEESGRTGQSAGHILGERLLALSAGEIDPVLVAEEDPIILAREGRLEEGTVRLFPWRPEGLSAGQTVWTGYDPAATAGVYHEAVEAAAEVSARLEALLTILRKEIRKLWEIETKIEADLRGFEDPDRYRHQGEALLAGLARARRVGDTVRVPDPYAPRRELEIPAPPKLTLPAAAAARFQRHRRATRGMEAARRRLGLVRSRRERLDRLLAGGDGLRGEEGAGELEGAMRREGIPVGLARKRSSRRTGPASPPRREEGIRMFTSSEGTLILVGRTGPANDRLTFKLSSPEDFWLHVLGRPGAHVVLRNPRRLARPPRASLEEAAGLAAWFSSAREDERVEVQWTRRKNVRRLKGAARGTVTIKRFQSLRVRPYLLPGADETS